MPYDETDPEDREEMQAAMISMLERLTAAGWLQSARGRGQVLVEWTDAGTEAAHQFRTLFDQLGDPLTMQEASALLVLLDGMSPAGGESSERHQL